MSRRRFALVTGLVMACASAVQAAPVWSGSADLDGDGKAEDVTLTLVTHGKPDLPGRDTDRRTPIRCGGESCTATVAVGSAHVDVEIHGGFFGGFGVKKIDIDAKDHASELLITQRGDDDEDPPYVFTVITFDGTKLVAHALWNSGGYNTGETKLDGKGKLVLVYDDCPDRTTVTYARKGATIVETGRKTRHVRSPDTCAG